MKKPRHPVSDHAVLRYLERVCGMDIEGIRRDIGRKVDLATSHPAATAVVVDTWTFQICDGVVTTVLPRHRPDLRTGRQRPERADVEA